MRRPDVVQRFFPAYAALAGSSTSQMPPMQMYKQWIQRVRLHEFADELIVAAAARELGVCIVCVPNIRCFAALGVWKISSYAAAEHARTIILGNNDVHYKVLLPISIFETVPYSAHCCESQLLAPRLLLLFALFALLAPRLPLERIYIALREYKDCCKRV